MFPSAAAVSIPRHCSSCEETTLCIDMRQPSGRLLSAIAFKAVISLHLLSLSLASPQDAQPLVEKRVARIICGEPMSHTTAEGRSYILRLPASKQCSVKTAIPFVVVIHCYGCTAADELSKYVAEADARGFGLVAPVGIDQSFHAPHCCGTALQEQVDDVGFIDSIVATLVGERLAHPEQVSVAGFSNGGFMASHLVSAASKSRTRWAAVATAAGHEYEIARAEPLPVAIHHCAEDRLVNASGCCRLRSRQHVGGNGIHSAGSSTCCCHIAAERCVSVQELFATWSTINRCASSKVVVGPAGARCQVGVSCVRPTSLCLYEGGCFHQQWAREFPSTASMFELFQEGGAPHAAKRRTPRRLDMIGHALGFGHAGSGSGWRQHAYHSRRDGL